MEGINPNKLKTFFINTFFTSLQFHLPFRQIFQICVEELHGNQSFINDPKKNLSVLFFWLMVLKGWIFFVILCKKIAKYFHATSREDTFLDAVVSLQPTSITWYPGYTAQLAQSCNVCILNTGSWACIGVIKEALLSLFGTQELIKCPFLLQLFFAQNQKNPASHS